MIVIILLLLIEICLIECRRQPGEWGGLYGLLDKTQTECEVQSLTVGTILYNKKIILKIYKNLQKFFIKIMRCE